MTSECLSIAGSQLIPAMVTINQCATSLSFGRQIVVRKVLTLSLTRQRQSWDRDFNSRTENKFTQLGPETKSQATGSCFAPWPVTFLLKHRKPKPRKRMLGGK